VAHHRQNGQLPAEDSGRRNSGKMLRKERMTLGLVRLTLLGLTKYTEYDSCGQYLEVDASCPADSVQFPIESDKANTWLGWGELRAAIKEMSV
jgi:hypothetical protein